MWIVEALLEPFCQDPNSGDNEESTHQELELGVTDLAEDGEADVGAENGWNHEQSVCHIDLLGPLKRDKRDKRQDLSLIHI